MHACNYYQQLAEMGHLCSLVICSVMLWQWYNILYQKNLCHRCITLYRALHISSKSTIPTTENTLLLFVAHLTIQQSSNAHQSTSVYQLHTIYTLPVETIVTSQLTPCLQWFLMVSNENKLQPRLGVLCIIANLVLQINTNDHTAMST